MVRLLKQVSLGVSMPLICKPKYSDCLILQELFPPVLYTTTSHLYLSQQPILHHMLLLLTCRLQERPLILSRQQDLIHTQAMISTAADLLTTGHQPQCQTLSLSTPHTHMLRPPLRSTSRTNSRHPLTIRPRLPLTTSTPPYPPMHHPTHLFIIQNLMHIQCSHTHKTAMHHTISTKLLTPPTHD